MATSHQETAQVEVVPYDPSWPARFLEEQALLEPVLQPWLVAPTEQIGSTAVPGLAAKPVIDLMAPVQSLVASTGAIAAASALGYCYFPYKSEVMHWFCKPSPSLRTHHLHIIPTGSPLWVERLAFRDALRRDANLAAEYARLKLELASRFRHDRDAYTEAKSEFIQSALSGAA
jgi:GrpB-like predicted nucleotidyltransferase (UPF0157 family)